MTQVRTLFALLAALLGGGVLLAPPAQAATVSTTLRAGCSNVTITVAQAI